MSSDNPVPPPLPPPLPNATPWTDVPRIAPMVSLSPGATPGIHELSLSPGTTIVNAGPTPTVGLQLASLSPDLLAIAGFIYWGGHGTVAPATAAGFITAVIVARLQPARPGASGLESIARGAVDLLLRTLNVRKKDPTP